RRRLLRAAIELDDDRIALAADVVERRLAKRNPDSRHRRAHRVDRFDGDALDRVPDLRYFRPARHGDLAEIEEQCQRVGARRHVGDRRGRLDDHCGSVRAGPRADAGQPRIRYDRRTVRGVRYVAEQRGERDRERKGDAPRHSHSLAPSSERRSFRTSRCFWTESGSLISWMNTSPSGVTFLTTPSASLSPAWIRYVLPSGVS